MTKREEIDFDKTFGKNNEINKILELIDRKKRIFNLILIIGIVAVIVILGIIFYYYMNQPLSVLKLGANIEQVVISEDGKNAYIKLSAGINSGNITEVKFIFKDASGNEYYYNTTEGIVDISIPYKTNWWNFFIKPKFLGIYDYVVSVSQIGLNNFNEVNEVSVSFKYKTPSGEEIETPSITTKKPTKPKPTNISSGEGSVGGSGGEILPEPCTSQCLGKECGDDGCGGQCNPGCLGAQVCNSNGLCEEILCTSDLNCSQLNDLCGKGYCNLVTSKCEISFNLSLTLCRTSIGECDITDYCSGSSAVCFNNVNASGTPCSDNRTCDGYGSCSEDIFAHRNFPHIRTVGLPYAWPTPTWESLFNESMYFMTNHYDVLVGGPTGMKIVTPNSLVLPYANYNNIQAGAANWIFFKDWTDTNITEGSYENLFVHFKNDFNKSHPYLGDAEDVFSNMIKYENSQYLNIYYSVIEKRNTTIFSNINSIFYIGETEKKFGEINFILNGYGKGQGLSLIFEYWNGSSWNSLNVKDGTNNLSQNGKIEFFPPKNWRKTRIPNDNFGSYYIKIRTLSVTTPPILNYLTQEITHPYVKDHYEVKGWNPGNDRDNDGYVNDSEFANLINPNATARFPYQARYCVYSEPSWYGFRWTLNIGNPELKEFNYLFTKSFLENPLNDGIFYDNSIWLPTMGDANQGLLEYDNSSESINKAYDDGRNNLIEIKKGAKNKLIMINMGENYLDINDSYGKSAGSILLEDSSMRFNVQDSWFRLTPEYIKNRSQISNVSTFTLWPRCVNKSSSYYDLSLIDRCKVTELAMYYLLSYDKPYTPTYFFYGGVNYAYGTGYIGNNKSLNWFEAIEYDIGQSIGDYFIFARGIDPSYPSLNYTVYARNYTNAFILFRPNPNWCSSTTCGSIDYSSSVNFSLNDNYYNLYSYGKLDGPMNQVSLRNSEGLILIKENFAESSCSSYSDCSILDNVCSIGTCSSGKCQIIHNSSSNICRPANGECDIDDYCTGSSGECLENIFKPAETPCSIGVCDGNNNCIECLNNDNCDSGFTCLENKCINSSYLKLIAYYPFDGNADDLSGEGHNGTLNQVSFGDGKTGQAANFDGVNSYIDIGSLSAKAYSISFWVYFPDEINSSFYKTTLMQYGNSSSQKLIGLGGITSYINGETLTFLGEDSALGQTRTAITNKISNGWHFIGFIYDDSNDKYNIYLDGVKKQTVSGIVSNTISVYFNNFSIGGKNNSDYARFNGSIDELKIWNYPIEEGEIADVAYPKFSDYSDNSGVLNNSGIALFSVKVANTNGSVFLNINGGNYKATNLTYNQYNVSVNMNSPGAYNYYWYSYGNGTNHNYNLSGTRTYVVNYQTQLYSCGLLPGAGMTYSLISDINDNTIINDCIIISAPDITFDCKGYSITSIQNYSGIYSSKYNTTIKNCNVNMGSGGNTNAIGIDFYSGANNGTIINNSISGDNGRGIVISSNYNDIVGNNVSSLSGYGILLGGVGNKLAENYAGSISNTGIYLSNANSNSIIGNIVTSNSSSGIFISGSSSNTFKNNIAYTNASNNANAAIYLYWTSSPNNIFINNTGICFSSGNGIQIGGSANETLINNIGISNSGYGVYLGGTRDSLIINQNATGLSLGSYGMYISGGGNNTIQDCVYVSGGTNDTRITGNSINNTFINCSYNINKERVDSGSQLVRRWYYRAYVNDSVGNPVLGADVSAYNVSGAMEFTGLMTDSNGLTGITAITDYVNNGGVRSYYSNYLINATKSTYTTSHNYNSSLGNNLKDVLTFNENLGGFGLSSVNGNIIDLINWFRQMFKLEPIIITG